MRIPAFYHTSVRKKSYSKKKSDLDRGCAIIISVLRERRELLPPCERWALGLPSISHVLSQLAGARTELPIAREACRALAAARGARTVERRRLLVFEDAALVQIAVRRRVSYERRLLCRRRERRVRARPRDRPPRRQRLVATSATASRGALAPAPCHRVRRRVLGARAAVERRREHRGPLLLLSRDDAAARRLDGARERGVRVAVGGVARKARLAKQRETVTSVSVSWQKEIRS